MTSAPVRLSLVMKAMQTLCTHYRRIVLESDANRKQQLKERQRSRRKSIRIYLIARGMLTGKKRKYEQVEEDGSSDSCDALDEVPRALDQAERVRIAEIDQSERVRIDGIVAERLAVFEVSEFLFKRVTRR